jgi:sortilin (neurotensin receptor 3)/BNR-Asp box repeat protein
MTSQTVLLVGTRRGGFIFRSDSSRRKWKMQGPYHTGIPINHMSMDKRGRKPRVFAALNSYTWGPVVAYSDDMGKKWKRGKEAPRFTKKSKMKVERLWHIRPWTEAYPDVVYLGLDPYSLWRSEDRGDSWEPVEGLLKEPTRKDWSPGGGGPCLHTIVPDYANKKGIYVGISSAGVYHSKDEGESWRPLNKSVKSPWLPEERPRANSCVHKMDINPKKPKLLYQQNHAGVYRSDNGGENWVHIDEDLPETKVMDGYTRRGFGFACTVHPHDPDTAYLFPLVSDGFRVCPEGKAAVYRTQDRGKSWEQMRKGLPQQDAYIQVLREGLTHDEEDPAGVYVGTTNGQVFYSRNEGDSWELMAGYLPPVHSVEAYSI